MADEEGAAGAAPIQTEVARPPRRPLTYVDPHLRVQTPADEAGWRVLDGVTVLIVETLHDDDDDDNVRTRLEFKYFADSRKGYRFPWYNGRPVFYLVRPTAEVSGFADLIICDNTDDDRDNTEFWAYSGGEGEYFFFVRETDPDPNLPATMSDLSWMEPDGPPPCWSGSHYGWGPYVSIAPTFESELMERVYKRWSILEHSKFKPAVREWVLHVMLCARRIADVKDAAGARRSARLSKRVLPPLPMEMWVLVVSMLRTFEMALAP